MKINYLKTGLILALIISSFSACKKGDQTNGNTTTSQRTAGDGDLDVLGHGYDIDGIYADARSSKGLVIDVQKIRQLEPNRIQPGLVSMQNFLMYSGKDANEYRREITAKFESKINVLLFSSTIKTSFTDEDFTTSTYSYATLDKRIIRRKLALYMASQDIKNNYLTSNFIDDCETMTPAQLVQAYGTHVLTDITLGGKLRLVYRSQINTSDKKRKAEAGVNLGGMKIFGAGVSVDGSVNYSQNEITNNTSQRLYYETVGGDATLNLTGNVDLQAPVGPSLLADLTAWQSSVTIQNSQLIDIDQNGLIPIYDLVPGNKAQEVKKYILAQYFGEEWIHGSNYFLTGDLIIFNRWMNLNNDYSFLLMKFPDRLRIIDFKVGQTLTYTNNNFSNVKIFEEPSPYGFDTFLYSQPGFFRLQKKDNTQTTLNGTNFYNNELNSLDKEEIVGFRENETLYPRKKRSLDLVRDLSSGTIYVRLKTADNSSNLNERINVYPISEDKMFTFNFSQNRIVDISNINGYQVGPAF